MKGYPSAAAAAAAAKLQDLTETRLAQGARRTPNKEGGLEPVGVDGRDPCSVTTEGCLHLKRASGGRKKGLFWR